MIYFVALREIKQLQIVCRPAGSLSLSPSDNQLRWLVKKENKGFLYCQQISAIKNLASIFTFKNWTSWTI